jgi:hypothetical protein
MAQNGPAALRRSALASARGVALAAHSAAGLCREVDKESERLLRCCEGLLRAAVARLDALGRFPVPSPATAGPTVVAGGGGAAVENVKKKRVRKKKGAPPSVTEPAELDDTWADARSPLATQQSARAPRVLVRGASDTASQPLPKQARGTAPSATSAPFFDVGTAVVLQNLITRKDLDGKIGTIESYDAEVARFAVVVQSTGERVRIMQPNLRASIFPLEFRAG